MHLKSFCLDIGSREDDIESVTENWRYFGLILKIFDQGRKKAPVAEECLFAQN